MNEDELKRSILYYPTISIPTGSWMRQALLYWDEIGSIVPHNWDDEPLLSLGPDVEFLQSEGEFRSFDPQFLIRGEGGWERVQEFEQEIKSIVTSDLFQHLPKHRQRGATSRIHRDKVSHELFYGFLEPKGLATEDKKDEDWYLFDDNTALLYMSLLAKYLADVDVNATVSGTDRGEYQNLIYPASTKNSGVGCLDARFKNSLPIPREDIPLSDIINFKRNRRAELLNFRSLINDFQAKLSNAELSSEINAVVVGFKEDLEKGVSDISSLMADSKIATIAGSFKTILSVKSPTLIGTFGVTAGHATKITELPVEWTVAGLGIMGAIEVGCHLIEKRNAKRATLRDSAFSYLYHAEADGIIS